VVEKFAIWVFCAEFDDSGSEDYSTAQTQSQVCSGGDIRRTLQREAL